MGESLSQDTQVVKRFDTFKLPKVKKLKNGFLQGEVVASRIGVFEYSNANGTIRRELRHPDEVFKTDSADTTKMIPFTDGHPNEFVNASNAAVLQKGYTGENWRRDEDHLVVSITVTDKATIDKITSGSTPEVSFGYTTVLVKEDGIYNGERYDHRQTNIEYNHLAGVDLGRAGRSARFRMDSSNTDSTSAECRFDDNNFKLVNEEKNMSEQDKTETKNTDAAFELQSARLDAAISENLLKDHKLQNLESKCDSLEAALNKANEKVSALEARNTDAEIASKVRDRTDLFVKAGSYLGEHLGTYLHHTDRQVMEAVLKSIKGKDAEVTFEGRSDEYVKGVFDHEVGNTINNTARGDAQNMFAFLATTQTNADSNRSSSERMMAQLKTRQGR